MSGVGQSETSAVEALWECYLLSGADPSPYTTETRTERGRAAGLLAFSRDPDHCEHAIQAVRDLRGDYDEACKKSL